MASHILVATDLSETADEAIRQAFLHARKIGATLGVCYVLTEVNAAVPNAEKTVRDRVRDLAFVEPHQVFIEIGEPYSALLTRAEAWGASRIYVGAHGHGRAKLLGNVAERVVRYATVPVVVARRSPEKGPILSACDLSDPSLPVVEAAIAESKDREAPLLVMHAFDFKTAAYLAEIGLVFGAGAAPAAHTLETEKAALETALKGTLERFGAEGDAVVVEGGAASSILELAASRRAQLVVVSTHGRSGFARIALGSVTERVVRNAPCSVLVVRATPSAK